jgi:hypothetical protein
MKTKHYTIEGPNDDCCQNWFQAHIICHTARTIAYAGANSYTMLIRFGDVEQKLQSTHFRHYIICFCSAQWLDIGSQPVKISLGTSLCTDFVPAVKTYSAHCGNFVHTVVTCRALL